MLKMRNMLGRTGLSVSPLGFGGAEIGLLERPKPEVDRLLNSILDLGINVIDTAAMYASSEALIGETISDRRDDFVLISKCGTEVDDRDAPAWSPELITYSVDRSLRLLKAEHLDVMFLHSCSLDVLREGDALEALIRARDEGKIRFVGYSGDNEAAAYAASLADIEVIETSINLCDQANIDHVLPRCVKKDLGVVVKRPIANAAWRNLADQPGMYQNYAKTYTERLSRMGISPGDLGFDGDPAEVWPEIALRFTLTQQGVHCAIIGTTNPEHVKANIEATEKGPLPNEAVEKIRDAFQRAQADAPDAPWTGQT